MKVNRGREREGRTRGRKEKRSGGERGLRSRKEKRRHQSMFSSS